MSNVGVESLGLSTADGHLYIAFYGTCVSLLRASDKRHAERRLRARLGKGSAFNVRRATRADIDRWAEAGGRTVPR